MVLSASLVMIAGMTFKIPFIFQGAIFALIVSRESPQATLKSSATLLFVTCVTSACIIFSINFVIDRPSLHFFWVIVTLFMAFFAITTFTNYQAALAIVITLASGIPLWDRYIPAESKVEDTLWLCLATLVAVVITTAVELIYVRLRKQDQVLVLITERLSAVEKLLNCYAEGRTPDPKTEQEIVRLEMLGTSTIRTILRRSNEPRQRSGTAGGVAVLVGRLVDIAASLGPLHFEPSPGDQRRIQRLAAALETIRIDLINHRMPAPIEFGSDDESAVPLLREMEQAVTLITGVYAGVRSVEQYVPAPEGLPQPTFFVHDAFTNPEHLRFAQKGCLAATCCYIVYNALDWQSISTSMVTCMLTAVSTVGASRQKQILRLAGAIVGGFAIGFGSQVFILPYVDSIFGFLVLFIAVTVFSAWFLTASPRLSYFGLQVAVAFYLINLQEFKFQTSLTVARDRVVGVLVGLSMMWLVFDQIWRSPAAVEMKRTFASCLRLIAEIASGPIASDSRVAIGRTLALRDTINASLDHARALADGVLFEFGPSRQRDLESRNLTRQWQPALRTLFILRIAVWRYRAQLPGYELPETVRARLQEYDENSARILEELAGTIEGQPPDAENRIAESHELLNTTVEAIESAGLSRGQTQSFIALVGKIDDVTTSLASSIDAEASAGRL